MRQGLRLLLVLGITVGCGKSGNGSSATKPPPKPEPRPPAPVERRASDAELATLVAGNNAFALDLYGQLKQQPGNLAFSPASVSTALAMTYAGAAGDTAAEMKAALHFELDQARLHPAYHDLIAGLLTGPGAGNYQLAIANRLWGDQQSEFLADFLTLTKEQYGAELAPVDFRGDPEGARKVINQWVAEETKDRIKDLLGEGTVRDDSRLVLTNAVHFKGDWREKFEKERTTKEPFYAPTGELEVQMMHQWDDFPAYAGDEIKLLVLPYEGDDLQMVVLLPDARDGLAALEAQLSLDKLEGWIKIAYEETVNIAIPRFEVTSNFALEQVLPELGMKAAFSMAADFSGINGKQDLYITAVAHKAFVRVDEEGSEAAAATAVVTGEKAAAKPREVIQFIADHPFIFLIRDQRTGAILFLGRVIQPAV